MYGHSSGGIGLVKLCLKWHEYKKENWFDVVQGVSVLRPAVQYRGSSLALQCLSCTIQPRWHEIQYESDRQITVV